MIPIVIKKTSRKFTYSIFVNDVLQENKCLETKTYQNCTDLANNLNIAFASVYSNTKDNSYILHILLKLKQFLYLISQSGSSSMCSIHKNRFHFHYAKSLLLKAWLINGTIYFYDYPTTLLKGGERKFQGRPIFNFKEGVRV